MHRIRSFSLALIVLVLAALTTTPARAVVKGDPLQVNAGDMRLLYHPHGGVKLSVFGIPMIKGTSMYFIKPKWVDRFYGQEDNPHLLDTAVIEDYQGGKRITLNHTLPPEYNSPVAGREVITLLPDNTYSVTLEFTFNKDEPALIEWQTAALNPTPLIGTPYTVTTIGKTTEGVIPAEAKGPGIAESTFAKAFDRVEIQSRIGPIVIESDPDDAITFFDYRKNVWATEANPIFWLGGLEREVKTGTKYEYTVTIKFPSELKTVSTTTITQYAAATARALDDAQSPHWVQDHVIPKPKGLKYANGRMPISSNSKIYVGEKSGAGIENAVAFLLQDLKDIYRIEPEVIRRSVPLDKLPGGAIVLGEAKRHDVAVSLIQNHGLKLPDHDEGYALHVDAKAACVAANTERGVFYGVTTLLQLIQVTEEGVSLRAADVVDYPSLDFRGVHCLSGKNAGDEIAKALRTLMARFKMNSLVWECEYIIWDGHEDIAHKQYGMTKKDARKVVDAAKNLFIEIIPLVQSLGHSEWIFTNDKNLDIAEDPETPYAYNPTNPRTYEFIFDVYQRAVDFFKPRYFHIGHDEVTMRGRFPYRSKDTGKTITDLILMDINKLHDWFQQRDIRLMMWGDMFLFCDEAPDARFAPSLEEAQKRRSLLPKDVVITDWHYAAVKPEEYTSIKIWKDAGFDTIGAGWDNPVNIRNLAQACVQNEAEGYLQTTWAGFNFKIDDNEESWHQYWAYILAGHYAWSGDTTPQYELPFSAKEKFLDVWFGRTPLLHPRPGYTVDLRNIANRSLADNAQGEGWLGYGPDYDFSAFPTGSLRAGETLFDIRPNDQAQSVVLLAGRFNPKGEFPEGVELLVSPVAAGEIHFLLNTAFQAVEKARVGEIEVFYENGQSVRADLVYGKNIFAFYDTRVGGDARIAWEGRSASGRGIRVWDLAWKNPRPGKKISSIALRSAGTEASPVLFAVTLVAPEKKRSKFLGLF